jgi:uncharacterized protein (TIRG00374 family)
VTAPTLRRAWLFQLAATALITGIVLWRTDVAEVLQHVRTAGWEWYAAGSAVLFISGLIRTLRWRVCVERLGALPVLPLFGAYWVGNLFNNALPLRMGDVAKIQIVANRFGLSRAGLTSALYVSENVLDLAAIIAMLFLALAIAEVPFIPSWFVWGAAAAIVLALGAAIFMTSVLPRDLFERAWARMFPTRLLGILREGWPNFQDGMEPLHSPTVFARYNALNITSWLGFTLAFWAFGQAFHFDVSLATYLVVNVATALVSAFPITFGNLGTYELVVTEVMVAAGVPRAEAFAFAASAHALILALIISSGLLSVWLLRLRPSDLISLSGSDNRGQAAAGP